MRGVSELAQSADLHTVSHPVHANPTALPPLRPADACGPFWRRSVIATELPHVRETAAAGRCHACGGVLRISVVWPYRAVQVLVPNRLGYRICRADASTYRSRDLPGWPDAKRCDSSPAFVQGETSDPRIQPVVAVNTTPERAKRQPRTAGRRHAAAHP